MTERLGSSERRNPVRQFLDIPVRVELNHGPGGTPAVIEGRTRDVSNKGAYFWARGPFHLGQSLHLTWNVPAELNHHSALEIDCVAEVIRLDPENPGQPGVGVGVRVLHFGIPKVTSWPYTSLDR
jgi:hypothetical protein